MNVLKYILRKEFLQIFRDKTILKMMFAIPTIQLIIVPLAMDLDVKNVNISIVDHDHSTLSQQLIAKVGASGYFHYVESETSFKKALRHIENEDADIVMEIPPGFERNLVREGNQEIALSVNAINGMKASLGSGYLNTIIADFNKDIRLNVTNRIVNYSPGISIDVIYSTWFNPLAEFRHYIVPGILVLLLTMVGGFLSALNIVREKESGTIEQINVTPIQKWQFILGKLIPFWVVGIIVFTLGLLVAWVVYGIFPEGSIALLYLFAAIYLVAILGFGLLISTFSNNQLQAMFIAFFFMMIFMLMSGLFTSLESMPAWARAISNLTPITHFIKVIRMIVLKGSGFNDIKMELLYVLMFAIVLNAWAIRNYKKTS